VEEAMNVKELEGAAIRSEAEFHAAIAAALEFPSYYGRNLNALWDVLTGDVERPVVLVWNDADASRAALGGWFDEVVELLRKVERQDVTWGLKERFELQLK
jgi:ribonuclease inhibitor